MKVELIDWTKDPDGKNDGDYTAALLEYIYQTKTTPKPQSLADLRANISDKEAQKTLSNIKINNLDSCFEFLNLTFCFQGITRQFLPELMKIKSTNIAFEEPRFSEIVGQNYAIPDTVSNPEGASDALKISLVNDFEAHMNDSFTLSNHVKNSGVSNKDALSLLPECRTTNAVIRIDLRMYLYAVSKRSTPNFSGEFKEAIDKTLELVLDKYWWLAIILTSGQTSTFDDLEQNIKDLYDSKTPMSDEIYQLLLNSITTLKG